MFEQFTAQAREVIVLAQEEAVGLRHNYIGTEHLLLGLLRIGDGPAARVLAGFGVTIDEARRMVARVVGPGDEEPAGQIPFTPRSKNVLELAFREALRLQSGDVGPEHILLGLAREGEGVAARILLDLGADERAVRQQTLRAMGESEDATLDTETLWARARASPRPGFAEPQGASPPRPALLLAVALAALGFPAGLLVGFLIWG